MWFRSDFHPWLWEEAGHLPMWHEPGWLYQQHWPLPHPVTLSALLSSAACLTEAEPCAPHSSASWVSVSPERHGWRGLWWILGGLHTTDQVPWMRVQRACGPSGQAISDVLFLLGFCVSLRIWAAVGESSLSLISLLSRAVAVDPEDKGGLGWDPCQYSESCMPCGFQVLLLALILIFTLPRG